jgi:hypothetical protein
VVSKRLLVVVSVLAFTVGAAAALVLYGQRPGEVGVQGVAEKSPGEGREATNGTEAVANRAEAGAAVEDGEDAGDEVSADSGNVGRKGSVVRRRAAANGRDVRVSRPASSSYVRVSSREGKNGGRGVAGHALGGVKKTGQVISKPFKKLGGVFHD